MTVTAVENAFFAHLAAMTPALPIAWPGRRYEPSPDQPYLRVESYPGEVGDAGQEVGLSAPVLRNGEMRIVALYPIEQGPGPIRSKAEAIAARFAWRQDLTAGTAPDDFAVRLVSTSIGRMITAEGWNSIPVKIRWRATSPS